MLSHITIDPKSKTPLFLQISRSISNQIEKGIIKKEAALPSINLFNEKYGVARDTVERAYKDLKSQGYITSVNGKGYFVVGKKNKKIKILFILNKISSYKEIVYYSFLKTLGNKAVVELQIHHYNPLLLKEILDNHLGRYDHYVIMPHFETGVKKELYLKQIRRIPLNELVILDKALPQIHGNMAVYQDFKEDIYNALTSAKDLVDKYKGLTLFFPEHSNHPPEITEGVAHFCKDNKKSFKVVSSPSEVRLTKGMVYLIIDDDHLAVMMKKIRRSEYRLGKDIGIISFNETELKDLLGITVISTDFHQMGHTAANLILQKQNKQIKNPYKIIKRGSL